MKPFDYERTKPYKWYDVMMPVGRVLLYTLFRPKVIGKENIPADASGIILCSNHLHSIDPVILGVATKLHWRFIAKMELFEKGFLFWFFTHCNAIPVDREKIDRQALDCAVASLEEGSYGLGIFPEGQRSPDGSPQEGKNGVAMLARKTKSDILPCSIYHAGDLKFRRRITIRIGELIPFEELGLGDAPNARQTRQATAKIMEAVTALWVKKYD
ncbi:MAG: 1-acyl-sn-glycerol-3-phosphate acyltransferase [Oscillospiraceae bacterium]|jgi:1-acyl-sn-glycerol-3-phosphate acyltransferase|nr:1-acyl-sn-glycerol-3-phosphate acyltransferase [Oscillospiraceae bacterium]